MDLWRYQNILTSTHNTYINLVALSLDGLRIKVIIHICQFSRKTNRECAALTQSSELWAGAGQPGICLEQSSWDLRCAPDWSSPHQITLQRGRNGPGGSHHGLSPHCLVVVSTIYFLEAHHRRMLELSASAMRAPASPANQSHCILSCPSHSFFNTIQQTDFP